MSEIQPPTVGDLVIAMYPSGFEAEGHLRQTRVQYLVEDADGTLEWVGQVRPYDENLTRQWVAIGLTDGPRIVWIGEVGESEESVREKAKKICQATGNGRNRLWFDGVWPMERVREEFSDALWQYQVWYDRAPQEEG